MAKFRIVTPWAATPGVVGPNILKRIKYLLVPLLHSAAASVISGREAVLERAIASH